MDLRRVYWHYAIATVLFSLLAGLLIFPSKANAYGEWVDCVIVERAGLSSYPRFGYPSYEVKVSNGCDSDMDTIKLEFDSGSYDVFSFNSQSVYFLSYIGKTVTFELRNIKPGYYSPSLKITAYQDWSYKRVRLPSYTINAPEQPRLGNNGGSVNLVNKVACTSATGFDTNCQVFPSWIFEMCSSNPNGTLQEFAGGRWVKLWTVKGYLDTSACDTDMPYAVDLSGDTSLNVGESSSLRIVFKPYQGRSSYIQKFKIRVNRN